MNPAAAQVVAEAIAANHAGHVEFLRSLLGSGALPLPLLNIGDAFSSFLDQAVGTPLSPAFLCDNSQPPSNFVNMRRWR